jgi:hypothetical protein
MAIIAHVILRNLSKSEYDAVRKETGWLVTAPEGGHAHLTWWDGADCHSIDAWDSEGAFGTFAEMRLGPGMARAGVTATPEVTFHAAHEVYAPRAVTMTVS